MEVLEACFMRWIAVFSMQWDPTFRGHKHVKRVKGSEIRFKAYPILETERSDFYTLIHKNLYTLASHLRGVL